MRTLYLLRHGRTDANEKRLYCGSTDLPLSSGGRAEAMALARQRPLPACALYVSSGMARANQTLEILAGRPPDQVLPGLREMDFGRFELLGYETLRHDPDYQRWIGDTEGHVPCPGGESTGQFRRRVTGAGGALLAMEWPSAVVVCHGGVIVALMQGWFPEEPRHYYDWQPGAGHGWRVHFEARTPVGFEPF